MAESKSDDNRFEGIGIEWEGLGVSLLEANARVPLSCEADLCCREVDSHRSCPAPSGRCRDIAGASRDIEDLVPAAQMRIVEQRLDGLGCHKG